MQIRLDHQKKQVVDIWLTASERPRGVRVCYADFSFVLRFGDPRKISLREDIDCIPALQILHEKRFEQGLQSLLTDIGKAIKYIEKRERMQARSRVSIER